MIQKYGMGIGLLLGVVMALQMTSAAESAEWKAAAGSVAITPKQPMWMAGYAARDKPSEGAAQD
ncbi:MAG: hypothetical protein KDA84_25955, partial [Planctomycetaceae bacterium]|nr:hypothetical protein [Planctomycetaceae bacterium]